jgi:hypothetical protein
MSVEHLEPRNLLAVQIVGGRQVLDTAGLITLTLRRAPGPGHTTAPAVVAVNTIAGTAAAGVDFAPIHQDVGFRPGESSTPITIPIFPGDPATARKTFTLAATAVPHTTNPADMQSVVVTIIHKTNQVRVAVPPRIKTTQLLTSGDQVTGFMITFDKNMQRGAVQDVKNYDVHPAQDLSARIPLLAAVYNGARRTVTLVAAQAVPTGRYVVENPGPNLHSPIVDTAGVALDGVGDGSSNGILYARFIPHGPRPSPVFKAKILSDRRAHAIKQRNRGGQLGSVLGLGLPYLL